jgi:Rv0078B-related antitoxin
MTSFDQSPAAAFRTALELFEAGVDVMRQNLRRRYPGATPAEIERRLGDWLHARPGAQFGDCAGRVVDLKSPRA